MRAATRKITIKEVSVVSIVSNKGVWVCDLCG